ncbi:MAG: beta-phosphoglucomutase family hydrolase [Pseudoalteromonas rhizosphaerae]|uniref:HAD family hydrolase n=1 Tax=Pseudoalteromonas TaxID=53246 RepID=UPI00301E5D3F
MLDLTKYQGIIFDMDGTLIDSMGSHLQAWELTCHALGYPFDYDYMYSLGGVPTLATVDILNEKYGLSHDPDEVAKQKYQFWLGLNHQPEIITETVDVLNYYHGKMPIGVGTGADRAHAIEHLTQTGLIDKIDALVTASDVRHGKPHPETFLSVAKQINIQPQNCVVFEDTQIGYQAAQAGGMDCILVKDGKIQLKS